MKKGTGWVWCVCLAILVAGTVAAQDRSFTGGRFAMVLDGETQGYVKKSSGGFVKGEVATHQPGGESIYAKKSLVTTTVEPLVVEVGLDMGPGYMEWIKRSFAGELPTRNAEIVACDSEGRVMARRELINVVITEVTFPTLDGSSKEAAYVTVTMAPEKVKYSKGDGSQMAAPKASATKRWLSSNFRIELGDLPTKRVSKIDSFTWKRDVVKDEVGTFREPTRSLGQIWVPDLELTISNADVREWEDWYRSFVIDGRSDDSAEKTGKIEFLSPDLTTVIGSIDLMNVGLIALQTEDAAANKEEVARFTVELYVEQLRFSSSNK